MLQNAKENDKSHKAALVYLEGVFRQRAWERFGLISIWIYYKGNNAKGERQQLWKSHPYGVFCWVNGCDR